MSSIVRSALAVLLFLCLPQAALSEAKTLSQVADPIFGVPLQWAELPGYSTPILGLPASSERRELARVEAGHAAIVLVMSLVVIQPDLDEADTPLGHEVDSGQLVKDFGNYASPLGAASGDLGTDYPELRSELVSALLASHLDTVLGQYKSFEALQQALSVSPVCGQLDALALTSLSRRDIEVPPCVSAKH